MKKKVAQLIATVIIFIIGVWGLFSSTATPIIVFVEVPIWFWALLLVGDGLLGLWIYTLIKIEQSSK